MTGCQSPTGLDNRGCYELATAQPALSQSSRVKFLVIHYTAEDFPSSLQTLTAAEVSAHYLIPAQPPLRHGKPLAWQLVPENEAAWHAGVSYWRGQRQLNLTSIGIELENAGYRRVGNLMWWTPFTAPQLALLTSLARDIVQRHRIAPQDVVAHSDIAPQRKMDPGPLFPWRQLAAAGVGAWPDPARVGFYLRGRAADAPVDRACLLDKLARYGYPVRDATTPQQQRRVIGAFQMHFRPQRYDGVADAQSAAIADALLEKYGAADGQASTDQFRTTSPCN